LPSLVFFMCSLLSKEDAVAFPALIILSDIFLERKFSWKASPFIVITAGYLVFRRYFLHFHDIRHLEMNLLYLGTLAKSFFIYIRIIFAPFDLHFERFLPVLKKGLTAYTYIALFTLGLVLLMSIYRKHRVVLFSVLAFFAVFFPVSNIIPIYSHYRKVYIFMADHFLYLPLMFVLVLTAIFINRLFQDKNPFVLYLGMGIISIYLLFFHFVHIRIWKDEETFYNHVSKKSAFPFRAYNNLAEYYQRKDDPRCLQTLEKMRQIMPADNIYYYIVKANWYYFNEKNIDKAIQVIEDGLDKGIEKSSIYFLLGDMHFEKGNIRKAITSYQAGIQKTGKVNYLTYFRLGFFYSKLKDKDSNVQALKYFEKSYQIKPDPDILPYIDKVK